MIFLFFPLILTSLKLIYNIKYYEKTFYIIYIVEENEIYLNKFIYK